MATSEMFDIFSSLQTNGTSSSLGPHMCLLGDGLLILRGIWNFLLRNKYSGQVISKNKINILSRNETKQNTAFIVALLFFYPK
jgi:hypothetical protein